MSANDAARVTQALAYLQASWEAQPTLEQVASHLGLSSAHVQRVFKRYAGVSPKRFLQVLTARHAREVLKASRSVLDAAFDVGLSGPGRLHDLTVQVHAMSPGEIRRGGQGTTIHWGVHDTPVGRMGVGITPRGMCHLAFVDEAGDEAALHEVRALWPQAAFHVKPATTRAALAAVFEPGSAPTTVVMRGTNFQVRVWEALLRIPEGALTTYGALAHWLGKPRAARAVGSAVAKNTLAYLIPCHRVIRASGVLAEYRWGPARKQALVGRELLREAR